MTRDGAAPAAAELSRIVHLDRLPPGGVAVEISASAAETAALAVRFGFRALPRLAARVAVDRRPGGLVVVEGRIRATIVQDCVVTLDPVEQAVDEPFRLTFAERAGAPGGDLVLSVEEDTPEPLSGPALDVGELVAEQLALAADPFPRRPGARLEDVLPAGRAGSEAAKRLDSPFAALAGLPKGKGGRKRK